MTNLVPRSANGCLYATHVLLLFDHLLESVESGPAARGRVRVLVAAAADTRGRLLLHNTRGQQLLLRRGLVAPAPCRLLLVVVFLQILKQSNASVTLTLYTQIILPHFQEIQQKYSRQATERAIHISDPLEIVLTWRVGASM